MKNFAKGLPLGLALGIGLTLALWKSVLAGRLEDPEAGKKDAAGAGTAAAGTEAGKEAAALKDEAAALRAESERLAAALAAARGGAGKPGSAASADGGQAAAGAASRKDKNPWASLGRKLYELRDRLKDSEDGQMDPEVQALWVEAIEIARRLAEELGIDLDEFEMSPYTLPMIMLAMLDASDTPPDETQSAALDRMVDKAEAEWKAFMEAKAGLTRLEARREMVKMTGAMFDGLWATMTPEQKAIYDKADMFARDRWGRPNWSTSGNRESATSNVLSSWASDLGLSEAQATAARPVVEDYIRRYEEMTADFARREKSGEAVGPTEKALATTDLMIDAQKRLGETVTLDDKQQKKLKNWGTIYGVEVKAE